MFLSPDVLRWWNFEDRKAINYLLSNSSSWISTTFSKPTSLNNIPFVMMNNSLENNVLNTINQHKYWTNLVNMKIFFPSQIVLQSKLFTDCNLFRSFFLSILARILGNFRWIFTVLSCNSDGKNHQNKKQRKIIKFKGCLA